MEKIIIFSHDSDIDGLGSIVLGKIAEAHGGSGHPAAAGVNITEKQKEYALVLRKNSNRESLAYLVNSNYNE